MRLKLNSTIMACILWMSAYYNIMPLQKVFTLDQANAIEYWLLADALYFAVIMFTKKHMWTWTISSFLFFATTNNMIDELWGNPLVYTLQEKMFLVVSIIASFAIGILTFKHPTEKNND